MPAHMLVQALVELDLVATSFSTARRKQLEWTICSSFWNHHAAHKTLVVEGHSDLVAFPELLKDVVEECIGAPVQSVGGAIAKLRAVDSVAANRARSVVRARGAASHPVSTERCKKVLGEVRAAFKAHDNVTARSQHKEMFENGDSGGCELFDIASVASAGDTEDASGADYELRIKEMSDDTNSLSADSAAAKAGDSVVGSTSDSGEGVLSVEGRGGWSVDDYEDTPWDESIPHHEFKFLTSMVKAFSADERCPDNRCAAWTWAPKPKWSLTGVQDALDGDYDGDIDRSGQTLTEGEMDAFLDEFEKLVRSKPACNQQVKRLISRTAQQLQLSPKELLTCIKDVYLPHKGNEA